MMIVVVDGLADGLFQCASQKTVFQHYTVLYHLVPSLDLALFLGMIWRTTDLVHVIGMQPLGQIATDVRRTVVAEQSGYVNNGLSITT